MKRLSYALKSASFPSISMAVLVATAAVACGTYDFGDAQVDEVEVSTTNPEWALDIEPIMTLKCMNCHTDTPGKFVPGGTPKFKLNQEAIFKALATNTERRVFATPDNPMPPNYGTPLSANELAALKVYLAKLKKAATPTPTAKEAGTAKPGATTAPAALVLSSAYTSKCVFCHQPKGEGAGSNKKLAGTALTEAAYISKVRTGVAGTAMAAYAADAISDADLKKDYAAFKAAK